MIVYLEKTAHPDNTESVRASFHPPVLMHIFTVGMTEMKEEKKSLNS